MPVAAPAAWRPSAADVAAIIPNRAEGPGATFTVDTRPTATQVDNIVRQVQAEVVTRVGPIDEALATPLDPAGGPAETQAGRVVAIGAAAYVERSFYPSDPEGRGDVLWERYAALLSELDALTEDPGDLVGTDGAAQPAGAQWTFPAAVETGQGTGSWERW